MAGPQLPRREKRFGKGPAGERDMDVDSDDEEDNSVLSMVDIRARVLNAGYTEAQLMETIASVSGLKVCLRVMRLNNPCVSMKGSIPGSGLQVDPSCSLGPIQIGPHKLITIFVSGWVLSLLCI
jgi:hypothetical protein